MPAAVTHCSEPVLSFQELDGVNKHTVTRIGTRVKGPVRLRDSGACVALQMDQLHAHAQKDQRGLKICLLTKVGPKQLWALLYSIAFGYCLYLKDGIGD